MSGESVVYDEPADWIVEQAQQRGVILSRRQLADWHRAGLISKPDREFLGRTRRQRVDLSRRHPAPGDRLLDPHEAIWLNRASWLGTVDAGFAVSERHWRDPLREAHQIFQFALHLPLMTRDFRR